MLALLQRVTTARVEVDGHVVGAIGIGLLVLVCAEPEDTESQSGQLVDRLLVLRVFGDAEGKMNVDLKGVGGGLLLVPQFTLAADTRKGTRPSFSRAAPPDTGRRLFDHVVQLARQRHDPVATGVFGAHMQVALTNDGPVTLWITTGPGRER
ncbi:MAG: D-aminoacyl-tRNA deacylase [Betaproteobacteria bacterium]